MGVVWFTKLVSSYMYMYFQVLAASEAPNVRRMRMNVAQFVLKIQNLTGYVDPVYAITDKPSHLNRLNT